MWINKFLFLLFAGSCVGSHHGRSFVTTNLPNGHWSGRNSGVASHPSLTRRSQFREFDRTRLSSSPWRANPGRTSRFASVRRHEADLLGSASAPFLRRSSRPVLDRRLHSVNQGVLPCSTRSRKAASKGSTFNTPLTNQTHYRGGSALGTPRALVFWENMVSGAVSRSIAQTLMHPANTMKTILQSSRGSDTPTLLQLMQPRSFRMLTRGAGANFLLSVPHGAVNFAVLEFVRSQMQQLVNSVPSLAVRAKSLGAGFDFLSSAISTVCCSVVSTPQMMITDNIMAGNYPHMAAAVAGIYANQGVMGFYRGWWPGLVGKIPSYALTWTFFQQLKRLREYVSEEPAGNVENTIMGCIASATTVCIMIPMDTIKTRLVTQLAHGAITGVPYQGIMDCALRISREEGIGALYRGLPPRLLSVVPMIGIQFGVYEAMKDTFLQRRPLLEVQPEAELVSDGYGAEEVLEEAAMEVAASPDNPFPAPHFHKDVATEKQDLCGDES